ncbi:hypothetical protein [Chitinophaga sp. LS1]|uniref:hypothetical protein n=1 Tax=Chitinophaga sp. LS1 TaxID=3051176 RepID=UPI002AAA943B|nr:hypothetical protein [Chitinophaga sp. LS1]WPV66691.1 hypothetical protein QQL36_33390 [Chitinophaga sp. LS1]
MLFFLTAGSLVTYAQLQRSTSLPGALGKGPIVAFPRGIKQSSGEVSYILASDTAGNINLVPLHANNYDTITRPLLLRKPFLKVHGNVMYDYYYQSGVVIPYISKKIFTSIQYRFISTSPSGINTPYASVSQPPEEIQPCFAISQVSI